MSRFNCERNVWFEKIDVPEAADVYEQQRYFGAGVLRVLQSFALNRHGRLRRYFHPIWKL